LPHLFVVQHGFGVNTQGRPIFQHIHFLNTMYRGRVMMETYFYC